MKLCMEVGDPRNNVYGITGCWTNCTSLIYLSGQVAGRKRKNTQRVLSDKVWIHCIEHWRCTESPLVNICVEICFMQCWRGGHGSQAWSLTALVHHRFSHSKHKCGGKLRRIWQRPMSTGSWMNGPQYCTEWVHSHIEAGLLFKSSGRSHSMCTSPLRHGEQWDACTRPLLAYCGAGLLRPLGCLIKSETITFAELSGKDACRKKKEDYITNHIPPPLLLNTTIRKALQRNM